MGKKNVFDSLRTVDQWQEFFDKIQRKDKLVAIQEVLDEVDKESESCYNGGKLEVEDVSVQSR
jgi:hypothetical protein